VVNGCFENFIINQLCIVYSTMTSNSDFKTKVYEGLNERKDLEESMNFKKTSPIIKVISKLQLATHYDELQKSNIDLLSDENPLKLVNPKIIVPMRTHNFFAGFLVISSKDESNKKLSLDDIKFLNILANFASVALENTRLQKITLFDGKTLLYTYDYFMNQLKQEFSKANRYNLPLSIVMAGIENFKEINEQYGHRFGDRVLKHVATVIKSKLRDVDTIAQYGGEAFVIILPITDSLGAFVAVDRIKKKLDGQTFTYKDKSFKVNVNFGIADFEKNKYSEIDDFIDHADKALIHAHKMKASEPILVDDLNDV
ncbi:MAG: sensor domain-containing diguanylate cyclase, partial [Spirochaetota bacterium]|nr:sensor domain-containing diguanylate cyclase [Spirochaetota bacterium]